ncbi:MAG: nicotinate-nucleotide--dimethylbenzimidazole phosphoribosyltransferase [Gammaproteobacteria bacterium]|nr:nicotinate-nucleotide--dimethylbenzimidazole phosphoribosyltransferase [Gammaproteobacteria bacterium]
MNSEWLNKPVPALNKEMRESALERQGMLTKPPGSLGRLEEIAVSLAAMQGELKPALDKVRIVVFAGDHGVVDEGVSAFPQVVTLEMIKNFARGGAAISVMAKQLDASLEVVDVGSAGELDALPGVVVQKAAAGTANFCQQPAMSEAQLSAALNAGREAVERGLAEGMQLFIGGEMGIGNTSPATAIAAALLKCDAEELAGPGTGLDASGVKHKAEVINRALKLHAGQLNDPLSILQHVGGFEIAALCGAYIAAAQNRVAILVDGFISSAAAMLALQLKPELIEWMFLAHASAEPGHQKMVEAIGQTPLLNMGMRLGEGSGAAVAVTLLRSAIALHNNMATFAEAGVSEASESEEDSA